VIAELKARIEDAGAGDYPEDLEETLDEHFDRLVGVRPRSTPALHSELQAALRELSTQRFTRARIDPSSNLPAGSFVHRAMGRALSRQVDGVLRQIEEQNLLVTRAIALLGEIAATIGNEFDTRSSSSSTTCRSVAEQATWRGSGSVWPGTRRIPGQSPGTARITSCVLPQRRPAPAYPELAKELISCDPVLDLGFSRVSSSSCSRSWASRRGVEPDEQLVLSAAAG
jgi:hypothetical protein